MVGVSAVRVMMIGFLATVLLLLGAVVGLRALTNPGGGNGPPIWDGPEWDGAQFVINDASNLDEPEHWASVDGIEWTREPGLVVGVGNLRCHPDFPCDLRPDNVPQVPLMFPRPTSWLEAASDDVTLTKVSVRYDFTENTVLTGREQSGLGVRIHPSVLAMAAREDDCFKEVQAAGPGYEPGPDDPTITGYGSNTSGNDGQLTATCRRDGVETVFTVNLADHLSPEEMSLVTQGSEPELWVVRADGSNERVQNPPMATYHEDLAETDVTWTSIASIVSSGSRFWAVSDAGLVTSIDGFSWQPWPVETGDWRLAGVAAGRAGDVALLLSDNTEFSDRGDKLVMVSHDEGQTWSDAIPVGSDGQSVFVTSVGPAGVALSVDDGGGERDVFLDDRRGEVVFSARSPLGGDALVVGEETILMPRERLAADGSALGPVLDVYDTEGELITTVFP